MHAVFCMELGAERNLVFVGGIAYVRWYKKNVLDKVDPHYRFEIKL